MFEVCSLREDCKTVVACWQRCECALIIEMSCADLGGRLVTRQELQRLQGILDSFPTTVAQDAAALQGELVTAASKSRHVLCHSCCSPAW